MRRFLCVFFAGALVICSCSKEDIPEGGNSSASAGDDTAGSSIVVNSSDDLVANTTFDRTVRVVYSSASASVSGADGLTVKVSGAGVTITNSGDEVVRYELSGSSSAGYFKLYSTKKQAIVLSSLSLSNPSGAAINNQSHKRTFVILEGASTLADGTYTDSGEDEKAAFFSEGQLVFSGSGSLTVKATGKSGITSDDYVRFLDGPSVKVSSTAGHGVRGKQAVIVSGGNLDIQVSATGKKGMCSDTLVYFAGGVTTIASTAAAGTVDGELTGAAGIKADLRFEITGGSLSVSCSGAGSKGITGDNVGYFKGGDVTVKVTGSNYGSSSSGMGGPGGGFGGPGGGGYSGGSSSSSKSAKAIKFDGNLYFSGGSVYASASSHEAVEAKGIIDISGGTLHAYSKDDAINSAGDMTISDGFVCGYSYGNDGLDANGNMYLKGGVVYAVGTSSPEVAIDANTEQNKKLYLTGGVVIAIGGLESGSSLSQATVTTTSWSKNTKCALYDGDDVLVSFQTPQSGGSSLVISHPSLSGGEKYTLASGVAFSGGTSYFDGLYISGATVSGGSKSTSLTAGTSTGGGGGMGR